MSKEILIENDCKVKNIKSVNVVLKINEKIKDFNLI